MHESTLDPKAGGVMWCWEGETRSRLFRDTNPQDDHYHYPWAAHVKFRSFVYGGTLPLEGQSTDETSLMSGNL